MRTFIIRKTKRCVKLLLYKHVPLHCINHASVPNDVEQTSEFISMANTQNTKKELVKAKVMFI